MSEIMNQRLSEVAKERDELAAQVARLTDARAAAPTTSHRGPDTMADYDSLRFFLRVFNSPPVRFHGGAWDGLEAPQMEFTKAHAEELAALLCDVARLRQEIVDGEAADADRKASMHQLEAEIARLTDVRAAATTDTDNSPGEIAIANYDEWRAFQAWKRAAATSAEPVAWALRWPDGRVTHSGASPLTTQELAAHRPEATVIPLYASPAPQVAALPEERDAAKRREREALDAHNASFTALDQIRLLLNQDDLDDYQNVVNGVAMVKTKNPKTALSILTDATRAAPAEPKQPLPPIEQPK